MRKSNIMLFNLRPAQALPLSKVNLAKFAAFRQRQSEGICYCLSSCDSPLQIAAVDCVNGSGPHRFDQTLNLFLSVRIDRRIGMPAESAGHIGLRMANEKKFAH